MKKYIFVLLSLLFIARGQSLAQSEKRGVIRHWIATFMTGGANSSTLRHFIRLSDGTVRSFAPGGEPEAVAGIDHVVALSASSFHILALKDDGTVWAWGKNDAGQLGNASLAQQKTSTYTAFTDSPLPVEVTGIKNAIDIAAVGSQSYALLADGSVMAWGKITHNGWSTIKQWTKPTKLPGISDGVALAGSMALLSDGSIMAWGDGKDGRLGNGTSQTNIIPVKVKGIHSAVNIAASDINGMALLDDGTVRMWGSNRNGMLGNGLSDGNEPVSGKYTEPISFSATPVPVKNIKNATAITLDATCFALLSDGSVWGWGWGEIGALGSRRSDVNPIAVKIQGIQNAVAVKAIKGGGFALLADGTLMGWGSEMIATGTYHQTYKAIKIASLGNLAPDR